MFSSKYAAIKAEGFLKVLIIGLISDKKFIDNIHKFTSKNITSNKLIKRKLLGFQQENKGDLIS
jgi:hypothetical protein